MLSQKALNLIPSPTLQILNRARELRAQGCKVVSLAVGEPDWPTFPAANEAAIQAIKENFSKYTPVPGIPELRTAVTKDLSEQTRIQYQMEDVCIASGAKMMIFAALQMICDPQDEILFPAPYWASYPAMVKLAGGIPRIVDCHEKNNFKLTPQLLEEAITPKTKAILFCNPNNPTGLLYSDNELKELGLVLKRYPKVLIISDDIYNQLLFTNEKVAPHFLHHFPEFKERLLVVNGASKAYSMTGWRVGWGAGPKWLMPSINDFMGQSVTHVANVAQRAALAALKECSGELETARLSLQKRRDWFYSQLQSIPGVRPLLPDGAFYCWTEISSLMGKHGLYSSRDISLKLLEDHHIATVPGIEFGSEGYLRLSFSTDQNQLVIAIERMKKFVSSLQLASA